MSYRDYSLSFLNLRTFAPSHLRICLRPKPKLAVLLVLVVLLPPLSSLSLLWRQRWRALAPPGCSHHRGASLLLLCWLRQLASHQPAPLCLPGGATSSATSTQQSLHRQQAALTSSNKQRQAGHQDHRHVLNEWCAAV